MGVIAHIVKLHRYGGGTSVVYYGFRKDCHEYAAKKNAEYQTDTYRVEPYQPEFYRNDWIAV